MVWLGDEEWLGRTVVHEKRHVGVRDQVVHLLARWVGGHDDDGRRGIGRRGEVRVVHQRDVGLVVGARREVELPTRLSAGCPPLPHRSRAPLATMMLQDRRKGAPGIRRTYKPSILQALHHLRRECARRLLVRVAGRGLVGERYLLHFRGTSFSSCFYFCCRGEGESRKKKNK